MKGLRFVLCSVGLATSLVSAGAALAQCDSALSFSDLGAVRPLAVLDVRPDLSNPGARALALGGAFTATADDATSIVTNPAGMTALNRATVQMEGRFLEAPQVDRYDQGLVVPGTASDPLFVEKKGTPAGFVGLAFPVGKAVMGVFGQALLATGGREIDRISQQNPPCFPTKSPSTGRDIAVLVPLYRVEDDTTILRTGVSLGYRLSPYVAIGATVFAAHEERSQTGQLGDRIAPAIAPIDRTNSEWKPGVVAGLQWTATEWLRLGAMYSSEVGFAQDQNGVGTVLPMRVSVGATGTFGKWAIALDGVYLGTSALRDNLSRQAFFSGYETYRNYDYLVNGSNWEQSDTTEVRLGVEYAPVETRTKSIILRLGGWAETGSNLRYAMQPNPGVDVQVVNDYVGVLYPGTEDETRYHVSGGFGALFGKKIQLDVGVDYEMTVTKRLVGSLLFGVNDIF